MTDAADDPFDRALAALLAPLAEAILARGLPLPAVTEALKSALVAAALRADGETASDSRVSLRTGIHRKDVKRLRTAEAPKPTSLGAAAMAASHWAVGPGWQDASGAPRVLSRAEFDAMLRETRADMAPGTVLALLEEQGTVEALEGGGLRLAARALVPKAGTPEQVAAYAATLAPHLAAATHNLTAPPGTPRHYDRALRYSHLSAAALAELEALARARAQAALEDLDSRARALQDREGAARGHFVFGAYILPRPGPEERTEEDGT
ncbi:DUF6502 family protein [Poseidonocella sp. HB161398]|uniref:DUF6502 family protein n=1 Tax=Poseidonocella sp. HB161398 TaxID=2320855 RepID=UPI001F0F21AE|nr:DUF6502 family protein [Poseidonocella sp. HB161398]